MKAINQAVFPFALLRLLLIVAIIEASFDGIAAVLLPGSLGASGSNTDLILSFPTSVPQFYVVQNSPDMVQWTNSQLGIAGDGTVKTVTATNALTGSQGFYRLSIEKPVELLLPQSTALAILGHSCGGIQEQVSAGFDVTNGYPLGVVDLSTSCGGSGRDGGGHTTTYTASVVVTWDLAGNATSAVLLTNGVTVDPTTPTDAWGDAIYNVGKAAYLAVPTPAAPIEVTAAQSGDQFNVAWTASGVNPASVTSSTLIATPVNSTALVLTATVSGAASSGAILSVEPQTTYQITVVNATIGGTGPASAPVSLTTSPATILPGPPTGVSAYWTDLNPAGTTDTLVPSWLAADPGNSPVDEYLVTIAGSDGAGTYTQTVSGTTLSTYFTVDWVPNWSVRVQAHNAAGWGPVSTNFNLGGL